MLPFPYDSETFKRQIQELVSLAIKAIRGKRFNFDARHKPSGYKTADLLTDADLLAQEIIADGLQQHFPDAGIVDEEDLLIEGSNGVVFTIDPLDGTKAFVRQESGNVSVMIGVVYNGRVVAVFIGDVWTHELYYYRPGSSNTHRLIDFDFTTPLQPYDPKHQRRMVLFREDPYLHQALDYPRIRSRFTKFHIDSGSIGINFTKLWKGEACAVILKMRYYTPWDMVPVIGLSKQLGYCFYRHHQGSFMPFDLQPSLQQYPLQELVLVCHPCLLDQFNH